MWIVRYEKTVIPQSKEGYEFSQEYAERLKTQNAFVGIEHTSTTITVEARFNLKICDFEEVE